MTRVDLDITQRELAAAVGVSRSQIAEIESGRANPPLALVDRIGEALGLDLELVVQRGPIIVGGAQPTDLVHASCSAYVQRRLTGLGLQVAREVEIVDGRSHGWIDLLAYDRRTRTLLIIEIKTSIDDIGRIERQIAWYERLVASASVVRDWRPERIESWLLVLATVEVDSVIARAGDVFRHAFPLRAPEMRGLLLGSAPVRLPPARGLALIDPRSRRRDWLIACRSDGRRSPLPYQDRAGTVRLLTGPGTRSVASG